MSDHIKVVRVGVKKGDFETAIISNRLDSFQWMVDGDVDSDFVGRFSDDKAVYVVYNARGVYRDLGVNENLRPHHFYGQCIVAGVNNESEFVSLTDDEVRFVNDWLNNMIES